MCQTAIGIPIDAEPYPEMVQFAFRGATVLASLTGLTNFVKLNGFEKYRRAISPYIALPIVK